MSTQPTNTPAPAASWHPLLAMALTGVIVFIYLGVLAATHLAPRPWRPYLVACAPSVFLFIATSLVLSRLRLRALAVLSAGVRPRVLAGWCALLTLLVVCVPWLAKGASRAVTADTLVASLALVVLVPLAEELFFRGLLLEVFGALLGRAAALMLSSVLFGLLHAPQGLLWPMLILGFALGAVVLATGSVLAGVAGHVAWNALSAVNERGLDAVALIVVALGGLFCLAVLLRALSATGRATKERTG